MNNNDKPNVAVIITCHNYADLVTDAIQSVVAQDYPHQHIRMYICNDGSKDNSRAVIENLILDGKYTDQTQTVFAGHIGDIQTYFINNKDAKKQAYARNQCIRLSFDWATYFAILDADDLYMPNKISRSIEVALTDPQVIGFVYSDLLIHNMLTGTEVHEQRQSYDRQLLLQSCITSNAPLIAKWVFEKVRLYDIELSPVEDYFQAIKSSSASMLWHIPEPLSIYRISGKNSTITTPREILIQKHKLMRQKIAGEIPEKYE